MKFLISSVIGVTQIIIICTTIIAPDFLQLLQGNINPGQVLSYELRKAPFNLPNQPKLKNLPVNCICQTYLVRNPLNNIYSPVFVNQQNRPMYFNYGYPYPSNDFSLAGELNSGQFNNPVTTDIQSGNLANSKPVDSNAGGNKCDQAEEEKINSNEWPDYRSQLHKSQSDQNDNNDDDKDDVNLNPIES